MQDIKAEDVKLVEIRPVGTELWESHVYDAAGRELGDKSATFADRPALVNLVRKLFPLAPLQIFPRESERKSNPDPRGPGAAVAEVEPDENIELDPDGSTDSLDAADFGDLPDVSRDGLDADDFGGNPDADE